MLQRVLNENASFMTPKQNLDICKLLNKPHDNYLATEWEQVVLNAASKFGAVRYEPELGSSKPDLLFASNDGSLEFLADVTAPSDQGFHDLNPADAFEEELWRRLKKSNLTLGGFDVHIDPHTKAVYRGMDERIRLKLPGRAKWDEEIFNSDFYAFLQDVRNRPDEPHQVDAVSSITGIHIRYDPTKRPSYSGTYLSFTLATAKDRNPVYSALKTKGGQIKRARYNGMTGVFLCDGGCQMVSTHQSSSSFSVDDVIRYFFQQFGSVWFVTVFSVKESDGSIQAKLHLNPKKRGTDFSHLKEVVQNIYRSLPRPEWSPYNARYRIKARDLSGRYFGNLTTGGYVKMSAREILEILAGVKTVAQFEQNYKLEPHSNPFRQMLKKVRLIKKTRQKNSWVSSGSGSLPSE
jgi:hypothetical protein